MILALLFALSSHAAAPTPKASDLLLNSDRARGAAISGKGLTWTTEVNSTENGDVSKVTYEVKVL